MFGLPVLEPCTLHGSFWYAKPLWQPIADRYLLFLTAGFILTSGGQPRPAHHFKKGGPAMRPLVFRLLSAALTAALLAGCAGGLSSEAVSGPASSAPASSTTQKEESSMTIQLQVNGSTFTAALEQNAAARALVELLKEQPLTIQMQNYGGFEKVGSLGESLPASDQQTTTQPGDIVLYQGDQIVIFYGSNSWSYTRLGRVDDLTGWADALGTGDVTVTFSLAE